MMLPLSLPLTLPLTLLTLHLLVLSLFLASLMVTNKAVAAAAAAPCSSSSAPNGTLISSTDNKMTRNLNFTRNLYDITELQKHLALSAAAYCSTNHILSHNFSERRGPFWAGMPIEGFVPTYIIDAPDRLLSGGGDIRGFVGFLPLDQSIYIVFRGSSGVHNWLINANIARVPFVYRGKDKEDKINGNISSTSGRGGMQCCKSTSALGRECAVHGGWYRAVQAVYSGLKKEVLRLKRTFPSASVKITGHSLGGALAHLTAMEFVRQSDIVVASSGIENENESSHFDQLSIVTFGAPRVGDGDFAACASITVPSTVRVTHRRDGAVHLPLESSGYRHGCAEAYDTTSSRNPRQIRVKGCSTLHSVCVGAGDPSCSAQWKLTQTNVNVDHMLYLGRKMTCWLRV